jgi:hypothetical protein
MLLINNNNNNINNLIHLFSKVDFKKIYFNQRAMCQILLLLIIIMEKCKIKILTIHAFQGFRDNHNLVLRLVEEVFYNKLIL